MYIYAWKIISSSVYDTGTDVLQDTFLTCDKGYDVWEFEEKNNKRKSEAKILDSEVSCFTASYYWEINSHLKLIGIVS